MPVRRNGAGDIDTEPSRDRRADLLRIEVFAFDLAGLYDVEGERLEFRLLPELGTESLHSPEYASLPVANVSQRRGDAVAVPRKLWPVNPLIDIAIHSTHSMRRL